MGNISGMDQNGRKLQVWNQINLNKNGYLNVGNFNVVLNKGKSESIFNYEIVWTLLQTNMSAGLLHFNSLGHKLSFPALGVIPRTGGFPIFLIIGGFVCFLKTFTKMEAGSGILQLSSKPINKYDND
jgi:hypothetical protein